MECGSEAVYLVLFISLWLILPGTLKLNRLSKSVECTLDTHRDNQLKVATLRYRAAFGNRFYQTYTSKYFNFSAVESVTRIYGPSLSIYKFKEDDSCELICRLLPFQKMNC